MLENRTKTNASQKRAKRRIAKRLAAAAWGLFFIWVGASLLMDLSWGVGALGVSAIVLVGQAARGSFGLRLELFWVAIGVFFLIGGVCELNGIDVDLLPIALILAGSAMMLSYFRRGSRTDWHGWSHGTSYRSAERLHCCSWSTDDR